MRYLLALLALLFGLDALAADYAREQKWADEVLPSVLVGDAVWLAQGNGHKFLGLYTPADQAKAGVVVVHGIGVHPDWGVISALRQQLPEAGYATLSIQMPVLKADAKVEDYPPTFDEAAERLKLAVAFMKTKGHAKVVGQRPGRPGPGQAEDAHPGHLRQERPAPGDQGRRQAGGRIEAEGLGPGRRARCGPLLRRQGGRAAGTGARLAGQGTVEGARPVDGGLAD